MLTTKRFTFPRTSSHDTGVPLDLSALADEASPLGSELHRLVVQVDGNLSQLVLELEDRATLAQAYWEHEVAANRLQAADRLAGYARDLRVVAAFLTTSLVA